MIIENKNLDNYWSHKIDSNRGFPLIGNDARFYEREKLAEERASEAPFVVPDFHITPPTVEKRQPRHRADVPLKGVVDIANREL